MPVRDARRFSRAVTRLLLQGWIVLPWALFAWLGMVIACHRWMGFELVLSLGTSAASAVVGWKVVTRLGRRSYDIELADLLSVAEDSPAWDLFPHPVQRIKGEHTTHCQRVWGITPRTSGWATFRCAWRQDAAMMFGCFVLCLHPWWLGC